MSTPINLTMPTVENVGDPVPLVMILVTLVLSIIGAIGNMMILTATVLSPALKSRCHFLIALLATADFVVCCYLVHLRVLMLGKWYYVKGSDCFVTSLYGLFALNVQSMLGLALGTDRLLAVVAPLFYRNNRLVGQLHIALLAFVFLASAGITAAGFKFQNDEIVPVCLPPAAYAGKSKGIWIGANFFIAVLVLLVYCIANIRCQYMSAQSKSEASVAGLRRLLQSLTIVVAVYATTWFFTISALLVTQLLTIPQWLFDLIAQQLAFPVIINASINFFIYFCRNKEYRKYFLIILCAGRVSDSTATSKHEMTATAVSSRTKQSDVDRRQSFPAFVKDGRTRPSAVSLF